MLLKEKPNKIKYVSGIIIKLVDGERNLQYIPRKESRHLVSDKKRVTLVIYTYRVHSSASEGTGGGPHTNITYDDGK